MFKAKKTVSSILAAFNATISDLEAVQKASQAEAEEKDKKAQALVAESQAATAEAAHAGEVADKLKSLVGFPAVVAAE